MIDGESVVHELVLPASADAVFAMFVDPECSSDGSGSAPTSSPGPEGRSDSR